MRLLRRVSVRRVIALFALTFAASGCAPRSATTQPTPLPAVSPAPKSAFPAWIVSLSPTGEAKDGAQIRVRFANDVVPVEALESPDRSAALSHVVVEPALAGRFVFLTPRMIGFESDRRVPHGTRVRVTLTAGLADLAGHRLAHDLAWSFTTQPLDFPGFDDASGSSPAPGPFVPRIAFDASDAVDVPSLLAHATLTDAKNRSVVAVAIAPTPSPDPSASPTPASDAGGSDGGPATVRYEVVPEHPLAYDRTYTFSIGAGVLSQGGNLPTQGEYDRFVRSYGPFVYRGPQTRATTPERFVESIPTLGFSNPIDPASLAAAVTISPPAAHGDLASVGDDGAIALDPDLLEPDTTYVVRISAALRDRFGQTLGTAVSQSFRTTSLQANLGAPSGAHIFPAGLDIALNVGSVNLPERAFRAAYVRVRPEDLIAHDVAQSDGVAALLPAVTEWRAHPLAQVRNVQLDTALPLRSLAGGTHGMVAYGVKAKTVRTTDANGKQSWVEPEYDGAVQLTDLGVWTQWFPGAGEVRVRRLSDGTAVANASVDVFESFTEYGVTAPSTPAEPCASGTTGADGTWSPPLAAWAACASTAKNATAAPALLTVVRSGGDWAYARSTSYENGYAAGLSGEGWSAGTPNARGSLVSDRTLYQPGETAKFVGVSYFERDGTIARGRSTSFAIVATSPSGATRNLGSATPDAFGTFSVSLALPASAPVGAWQIAATGADGETLAGAFTVAEFKPPNFKVDLTIDGGPVVAGATVAGRARSSYLFGAAVGAGTARVSVTRARTTFSPAGYDDFSFGRQWSYPEEEPSVTSDVLQRAFPLDATGETAFAVPVGTDLPFPMAYTVTSETTDASNLAVADTKSFVALPSKDEIGLATPFVGEAGRAFSVRTVVVDPSGKARDGVALTLVLQQRIDASAPQIVEGSETSHDAVRYVDVATSTVTSGARPVDVPFTAPKAGEYRIRANVAGAAGDLKASDAPLWITGAGGAAWSGTDSDALVVKLDKATYRPGDVARVLVQSPYTDAEMSFAVVRHGVFLRKTTLVHGAAPEATFVVTADMLPNAAVQVVLVRRGAPLAHGVPAGVTKLARTGFAPFDVALDAKYLHVDLHAHAATIAPGGHERIDVRVTANDGAPVRGELTVAVVNDAILQLSGYRFPDLVKSVYASEPVSTRLADNYGEIELRTERASLDKGFGYGGGVMAGPAGTRVRTKFLPLAYWNAAVRTDATGRATIEVPLPDDLTTWRVMALALTRDARFGNGETTFVATKPLVTDPILPQFARPGDRFAAGVSVTNVARASGATDVRATLSGGAAFATGAPATARTSAPAADAGAALSHVYRFDVVAHAARDAAFTFRSTLGPNADAFTFGVPIVSGDVLESAITTGTTEDATRVPVDVAPALRGPLGGLDVTLASTLLAEALEPTRALAETPFGFATELGSRIAIASDAIVLDRRYGRAAAIPAMRETAERDLASLRRLALPDGGFAPWPGAKQSEIFSTAFVAVQLLQAKDAGLAVDGDLSHALAYVRKVLADPYDLEDISKTDDLTAAEVRLEALETLGSAGDARTDFLTSVWAQQTHFEFYERVELARFLLRLPAWHARGIALRDELLQQVNLGARHATVDVRGEFGESEPAGQAQMLQLAIASGVANEDVDRLLESLLALRHDGRWGCACDDAEAMNGLVLYAAQDALPPDFTAVATLPARAPRTERHTFAGYATTSVTDAVPIDDLARGRGDVVLQKEGRGTLHYAVALRYRVPDESPGIYAGLRIDRVVRTPGESAIAATFGLALPHAPTTVPGAHVYDVEDRIVTDHPVENVLVTDPLPAGFEAVDQSFRTSAPGTGESNDALALDYQSIYRTRVVSFVHHLDPGAYAIHYLVRSVTPGTFAWPGAVVQLQYEPEQFGRTAATQLVVTP